MAAFYHCKHEKTSQLMPGFPEQLCCRFSKCLCLRGDEGNLPVDVWHSKASIANVIIKAQNHLSVCHN